MALYEPNVAEMAECSETGLVKTLDLAGEVAIMARYQGQVSTFRATIPLGADTSDLPGAINLVDEAVFNKLRKLGIPASEICDDATFLRRVSLDITGALPSEDVVSTFLADNSKDKRDRLIDRLLESEAYADHFANKWNLILRNKRTKGEDIAGTHLFHSWIRDSIYENKPYNEFVRRGEKGRTRIYLHMYGTTENFEVDDLLNDKEMSHAESSMESDESSTESVPCLNKCV